MKTTIIVFCFFMVVCSCGVQGQTTTTPHWRMTNDNYHLSTKRTKPITIKVAPINIFMVMGSFRK